MMEDQSEFTKLFNTSMMEADIAVIDYLIEAKCKDPRFPLNIDLCTLWAAGERNISILRKLITLHPRLSFKDSENRRAIHHAAKNGHLECVRLLLKAGAAINCADTYGQTPLLLACKGHHVEVAALLVEKCAHINSCRTDLGENAVHVTASGGDMEIMQILLDNGGNPNMPCMALRGGETPLHKAVGTDRPDVVDLLISRGARVNVRDAYERYPIHIACERGHLRCLSVLIQHGNSLEIPDAKGQTPLVIAAGENYSDLVKLLIDNGANVHAVDKKGLTALHRASSSVSSKLDLIEYLVAAGADINAAVPGSLHTPLLMAVAWGRLDTVEKLIELGADLTLQDVRGHTAIHSVNYKLAGEPPENIMAVLLKGGSLLNIRDTSDWTPLQLGVKIGVTRRTPSAPCIQLLCQAGSQMAPDDFDLGKNSILFWLSYSGYYKLAIYLVRAGWDLRHESWIVLPGKDAEQDRLHQFLIEERQKIPSLLCCVRKVIRSHLIEVRQNREILTSIESLPVPEPVKTFLALKDIDPHDLSSVPGIISE